MDKIKISYPFLFYSLYKFYLTKWDFSKDWPQGWAVAALSMLVALVLKVFELLFIEFHLLDPSSLTLFNLLPKPLQASWGLILAFVVNYYYFLSGRKWVKYVSKYDELVEDVKRKSYWGSFIIIILIVLLYLIKIITFEIL
jgi:hypothetical protein